MARLRLPAELADLAGGARELTILAPTVRALLREAERRHPGLGAVLDRKMAFAIDGEIHQDAWASPIGPDSEVVAIPRIGGG